MAARFILLHLTLYVLKVAKMKFIFTSSLLVQRSSYENKESDHHGRDVSIFRQISFLTFHKKFMENSKENMHFHVRFETAGDFCIVLHTNNRLLATSA